MENWREYIGALEQLREERIGSFNQGPIGDLERIRMEIDIAEALGRQPNLRVLRQCAMGLLAQGVTEPPVVQLVQALNPVRRAADRDKT